MLKTVPRKNLKKKSIKNSNTLLNSNINSRSTVSKTSNISHVPPRNDLNTAVNDFSVDEDLQKIKKTTKALDKELQIKFNEYKKTNETHLERRGKVFDNVHVRQNELEMMKESLCGILKETNHTKQKIREMREQVVEETCRDLAWEPKNSPNLVLAQLLDLKKEIKYMSGRLSFTEQKIKTKTIENNQLKSEVLKLKENILDQEILDRTSTEVQCKSCIVF
jgi:hypothetical protein